MNTEEQIEQTIGLTSQNNRFIEANTVEVSVDDIRNNHIIPVFTKFNEPLISHTDFIGTVNDVVKDVYRREVMLEPVVRVSHPVKGRIPEAKHKRAVDLVESEKTLYYERMAFMIELPLVFDTVHDNQLQLTVGGVKAYNMDNYNGNRKDQRFKVFIGLRNTVCTNLCISTDGLKSDIVVRNLYELKHQVAQLIESYNALEHMEALKRLGTHKMQESQVTHLIGRLKMYNYLPGYQKVHVPDLRLTDGQLNSFTHGYYNDPAFGREDNGDITLWKLYNNLTGAFKSSYIDSYLEKLAKAHHFMSAITDCLEGDDKPHRWYITS
jgi:hypothetical protein